jgi:hypothetical protein
MGRVLSLLVLAPLACSVEETAIDTVPPPCTDDCIEAGVPPDGCSAGFDHDGNGGCVARLPSERCADGLMAVPGETACRPVMPCAPGKWGDIPIDATTLHVDASYVGGASDGSATNPFTRIGDAVEAAAGGALIAVASGNYDEMVSVVSNAVRIWGVCPDTVRVTAPAGELAAIYVIGSLASGTEVHGLGLSGSDNGVLVVDATGVTLDRVWVHDTGDRGIVLQPAGAAGSLTVVGSLIERSHDYGIYASGSEILIEASVVRDTLPDMVHQGAGRGIAIQRSCPQGQCEDGLPGSGTVVGSLVERNHEAGVFIGGQATIEGTLVRETLPRATDQRGGSGVSVESCGTNDGCTTPKRSGATLRGAVLERNQDASLLVMGSDVTLENTVVRDSLPQMVDQPYGRGINIQLSCYQGMCDPAHRSIVSLVHSVVERSHEIGLFVADSDVTLDATLIRDTVALADGTFGDGISVRADFTPTRVEVTGARIENSARAGFLSFGASVALESTVIGCAAFALAGESSASMTFKFEDRGNNFCGCPSADGACKVVSAGLEPPLPLP